MPISYTGLSIVMSKFPGRQEMIKSLFKKNESFQILCEDYRQCSEALKYWNESTSEDAAARRKEYESLLRDLGEEISQSLSESK